MTQVSDALPVHNEFGGKDKNKKDLLQTLSQSKIGDYPSLEYIIKGMHSAVISGTAENLKIPKVCIYAKTGTAPVKSNKKGANNASITGFAYRPTGKNPQCSDQVGTINQSDVISFACVVRYSSSSGGESCGLLMKDFFRKYFNQTQQGMQS